MNDYVQRTSTRCLVFVEWLNVGISSVRGAVHNWFAHHSSVCVVYRAVCSHVYAPDVFPLPSPQRAPQPGKRGFGVGRGSGGGVAGGRSGVGLDCCCRRAGTRP